MFYNRVWILYNQAITVSHKHHASEGAIVAFLTLMLIVDPHFRLHGLLVS